MRIAYDNILDNLTSSSYTALSSITNYPLSNVLDNRLTVQWISGSATIQTATFTLPTFPEYPDNATGTTAIYHFNATTESFTAVGGVVTSSTYVGSISLTATTASSSIIHTGPAIASSTNILIRARSTTAAATSISVVAGATTATALCSLVGMGTSFSLLSGVIVGSATALSIVRFIANNISSSGSVFDIDGIYIGTGEYTSSITDKSGNSNTITALFNVYPQDGGLRTFGRAGSYAQLDTTNYRSMGLNSFGISFRCEKISTIGDYDLALFMGSIDESGIFFQIYNKDDNKGHVNIRDNLVHISIIPFDLPTLASNDFYYIDINRTTNIMILYKNGLSIGSVDISSLTGTITLANPGYLSHPSYPADCVINDLRIYKRTLSTYEINELYNNREINNGGLAVWYNFNNDYKVNTASVLGHTIKSGTTVKIEGNNQDEWGAPSVSEVFTYVASGETILKFLASTYIYKYWRFYFSGQASLAIGRMWLSDYITISPSSLLDFKVIKKRSDIIMYGKDRQKFATPGASWRRFELSFPESQYNMIKKIEDIYDHIGNHGNLIFCNFDTLMDYPIVSPVYCSIDGNELGFNHSDRMRFSYSIAFEEDL